MAVLKWRPTKLESVEVEQRRYPYQALNGMRCHWIHFCNDLMAVSGNWTEGQWQLCRIACGLLSEFLLPEYFILSFAAMGQRLRYLTGNECRRAAMTAVDIASRVTAEDGRFIPIPIS
jgi:hypothetical protein